MDTKPRALGIEGLGDLSLGTHFCLFYETEQDLIETLVLYFKAGLAKDEFCLWITSDSFERARNMLRQAIPSADYHLEAGNIEILSCQQWFYKNDEFDAARALQGFDTKLTQVLEKGYRRMRVMADVAWLDQELWKAFLDYERNIDERFVDKPISIVCAYPSASHNAADILDIARTHRFIAAKRNGTWEILESPELKHVRVEAERFTAEGNELEDKIQERTAYLSRANQVLQAEIIERKQAEAELQKNKEILQTIFDNVPAMITMVDKDGKFILTNRDFESRLGWRLDELTEQSPDMLAELYPDLQARQAVLDFAARADGRWEDFRTKAKDGRVIDTSWAMVRLSDGSIIGVGKDNTEQKRGEEALRKSERVLREAEELGHTGSWEQDLVTGEIFNTEENLRLFFGDDRSKGADLEDYAQVVHPDDREYVLQRRTELLEEEGPGDIEYRVVWPDGSLHVIFGRATVVRDELGRPIRVYGTNVDITERKRAEESLRTSERILREAESLGQTGSWEQDLVTGETFNSEANLRLFFGDDHSKGASFEDFVQAMHPDDREYVMQRRAQLIAEGRPGETEFRVVWPDGSIHVIHRRATVVFDESGKAIRLYGTNVDITERKRAEEEIKRQAARSETLARIAARLNKQLDLDAVIHAVCQEAVDTFKVSQATMSLYDAKRDFLDYAGGVNIPPKYAAKFEPINRAQFEEFVRTTGPILVVPDIQSLPNVPNAEFSAQFEVRTVVTVDMRRDQQLIGVLVLGVNGQVREFDQDELSLLKAMSDQAAQAIANAQLLKTANEQRQQLRDLSAKLLEVQEAERRALTSELHDRVGQNLTGLSINLQNLKASLSQEEAQALAPKFDDAQALVEDTSRQIRDIMAKLHLPELEDYGLGAALETYAERAASRGNLQLIADLPDLDPPRLPSDIRAALFRAAQEAISNVLKHANATRLEVSLEGQNGRVRLKIEDNGQGFEPDAASQKEAQTWGLQIMRERIESIGGTVQIESEPGQGTRVVFEIERPS